MKTLFFITGLLFFVFPSTAQITESGNNLMIKDYPPGSQIQAQSGSQTSIIVQSESYNIHGASNITGTKPANQEINAFIPVLIEQLINDKN